MFYILMCAIPILLATGVVGIRVVHFGSLVLYRNAFFVWR